LSCWLHQYLAIKIWLYLCALQCRSWGDKFPSIFWMWVQSGLLGRHSNKLGPESPSGYGNCC
jgi:hypothetical protein